LKLRWFEPANAKRSKRRKARRIRLESIPGK
jgi:hypothetical protein